MFKTKAVYEFDCSNIEDLLCESKDFMTEKIALVAEPFKWSGGYGISFYRRDILTAVVNTRYISDINRVVGRIDCYDYDYDSKVVNLMSNLAENELRPKLAEETVWTLFFECVIMKNGDWLMEYFPKYYEFMKGRLYDSGEVC